MNGYNSNYFNSSSMKNLRKSIQDMVLETYIMGNAPTAAERESARRNAERARARKSGQPDPVYTNTPHEAVGSTPRTDIPPSITTNSSTGKPEFNISPVQKAQAESNRKALELARVVDNNPTKPRFGVGSGSSGQPTITGGSYVNPNSPEGRLRDQGWTPGSDGKLTPPDPEKDEFGYMNTPTGRAAAMRDAKADTQRQYDALKDASQGLSDQQFDSMVSGYQKTGKIAVPPPRLPRTAPALDLARESTPPITAPYGTRFQPSAVKEIPDLLKRPEEDSSGALPGPPGLGAAVRATTSILAPSGVARGRPVTNRRPTPKPTTNPRMFER